MTTFDPTATGEKIAERVAAADKAISCQSPETAPVGEAPAAPITPANGPEIAPAVPARARPGEPDYAAAAALILSIPGPGITVCAIPPWRTKEIRAKTFTKIDGEKLRAWIEKAQTAGWNIYVHMNGAHTGNKKFEELEITVVYNLHCDCDVDKSITDPEAFKTAKAELLQKIASYGKPPTLLIDSGNGYWCHWFLREPFPVKTPNDIEIVKSRNRALCAELGGDPAAVDISRISRVPFTINYPNETKKACGRIKCISSIVYDHRNAKGFGDYTLEDFPGAAGAAANGTAAASPGATVDGARPGSKLSDYERLGSPMIPNSVDLSALPDHFRKLIMEGAESGADRSYAACGVAAELIRLYWDYGDIIFILTNKDYKISAHSLDQKDPRRAACRAILNALKKGVEPTPSAEDDFADDPVPDIPDVKRDPEDDFVILWGTKFAVTRTPRPRRGKKTICAEKDSK